ncbi:MAG TPA: S8 family serine peptidase, partial [Polyangia bacterium]
MVKPWMVSLVGFSAWACGGGPDVDLQRPARSQAEQVAQATQLSLQADEAHQPVGRVFGAEVRNGEVRYLAPTDLPVAAGVPAEAGASEVAPPSRGEGAIHPRLEADLDSVGKGRAADRRVDVVVTFKQTLKLPRFPEPNVREARDSAENRAALARGAALVASIEAARAKTYDARKATLERQHGVIERERFWLIDGMLANVPLGRIRGLANHPDVQYVEYDQSDAPPPANLISDGRFLMRSDLFFGFTGSWIGMLDTGVRSSHSVFMNPGRITFTYDCNSGTSTTCNGTTPGDCWSPSHGTASANILSGNANLGDAYRGVTQITIDSFKVYTNDNCGYNVTAGQRAFARAVALSDKVILANIQERTSDIGATATAANNAYDAGVVVIGAAGNYGAQGASTVSAPGNATKVLAIGAIDVTSQALEANSGRGPSPDGRTKPDLTAPTNVFAAAVGSDTATRSTTYGGT